MTIENSQALAPAELPDAAKKAVAPGSIEESWRFAKIATAGNITPKGLEKPENALIAIQLGADVGLKPLQAVQGTAVINGRPSLFGPHLMAVIKRSPLFEDVEEWYEVEGKRFDGLITDALLKKDDTCAVCVFLRRGQRTPSMVRYAVGDAKRARLWGKSGPWTDTPQRMLVWRARSWAARDAFPDVLTGIDLDGELFATVIDQTPVSAPRGVRRLSEMADPEVSEVHRELNPPAPAAAAREVVGVIGAVVAVNPQLACATVQTGAGVKVTIGVEDERDQIELQKFVGTDHQLRFACLQEGTDLLLQSVAVED